jgi:predicted PurR-regulated permease PerM
MDPTPSNDPELTIDNNIKNNMMMKPNPTISYQHQQPPISASTTTTTSPTEQYLILEEVRRALNLIIVPLLILSGCCIGFVLVWAEDILVPFVISLFFTYLLRPIVDFLSRPLGSLTVPCCKCPRFLTRATKSNSKSESNEDPPLNTDVELTNLLESGKTRRVGGGGTTTQGNSSSSSSNASRRSSSSAKDNAMTACGRAGAIQVPRWLAIFLSMLLVMAMFVGLVVLVMDAMQTFEQESLSAYEERTVELANIALRYLKRYFNVDGSYMLAQVTNEFQLVQMTKSLLLVLMNAVAYTFIVLLFVLYMLFEGAVHSSNNHPPIGPTGAGQSPSNNTNYDINQEQVDRHIYNVRRQIDNQIQRYLVTKTAISAVVGALTFLVLGPLLHVKMAHLFGVVTFLMNFIPNVGAVIATLLPLPIVILDPNLSALAVVLAFVLPTTIHTVVGNIVEPIFFGQQMELHPVVVLLSLSFWFSLWGVAGAILSVPITAVIRIVVSNISHPYAQFAKNLLEGRLPGKGPED